MQSILASNSLKYIHASVPLIYALLLASISVYPTETLNVKPNTFFLFLNSMLSGYTTLSLHNIYYDDFKIFFPLFLSKLTAIELASSSVVKTTCLAFTKSQSDPQHYIKTKRNGKSKTTTTTKRLISKVCFHCRYCIETVPSLQFSTYRNVAGYTEFK